MNVSLTPTKARQEYLHYLSAPDRRFIPYAQWKVLFTIEVESTPYVKKLIELTGYPGKSEADDIRDWIEGQLDLLWRSVNDWQDIMNGAIDQAFGTLEQWISNIFSTIGNVVNTIGNLLGRNRTDVLITIEGMGEWIEGIIESFGERIIGVVEVTAEWIAQIGRIIGDGIADAIDEFGDRLGLMYEQFADAIDKSIQNGESRFNLIGGIIIAGIQGAVDLAVSIVDGLSSIIVTAVESTEKTLTRLIDGIVVVVDTLVSGAKEIIEGTITTLIDWLKWLWEQITGLLDQAFDLNLESMAPMFVKLFDAQKKAFELIKERAETVQP